MSLGKKQRFDILKRDDFTCQYCGKKTPEVILEVDHVIPKSKNGSDDPENLVTSCFDCNRGKGAELLDTVLKDEDIHDKTILMAERERQLKEYNYVKKQIRERETTDVTKASDYFSEKFKNSGYTHKHFPAVLTRDALKILSVYDILDLIDYAVERTEDSDAQYGKYHDERAAKFLAGILRNKIKDVSK